MRLFFDQQEITVAGTETVLDVAGKLGVEIPTLCFPDSSFTHPTDKAATSCLVCLVKVNGKFVPACATRVEDGMRIESETDEVRKLRRTSLELLLSNHLGDCYAPCQLACPAKLDIPKMLRQIAEENWQAAIQTIKETIPIPAILGRVCPKPCEKICRRKYLDEPVSICEMKRIVADHDLATEEPYRPELAPPTGKRVMVVGAGPSGLTAAYYLARAGHQVKLYAQGRQPGGRLRRLPETELPQQVIDAEIKTIRSLPIDYYPDEHVDWLSEHGIRTLTEQFDAVLLCPGPLSQEEIDQTNNESNNPFGIENGRLVVAAGTYTTSIPKIFAAGTLCRSVSSMIVRSVADGREAAESIDRFLKTNSVTVLPPQTAVKLGKLTPDEIQQFCTALDSERHDGKPAYESRRCLHCDCRGREKCRLLKYSAFYGAKTDRFDAEERQPFVLKRHGSILFEPGKCIKCGLCISVTKKHRETLGLTFIGRGFDVQVAVPFDEPMLAAMSQCTAEVVSVCPTAALSFIV